MNYKCYLNTFLNIPECEKQDNITNKIEYTEDNENKEDYFKNFQNKYSTDEIIYKYNKYIKYILLVGLILYIYKK